MGTSGPLAAEQMSFEFLRKCLSGSGISWTICRLFALHSRQITRPAHYQSGSTTTTILFLLGLLGWAGIGRNIHPLTPILIINHLLSAASIQRSLASSIYVLDSLFAQFLCKSSLVYLSVCNPHFIPHKFFHPIIVRKADWYLQKMHAAGADEVVEYHLWLLAV